MTWHFKRERQEDTKSESKLGEFFSPSPCLDVVRESIQNSLDATAKGKQSLVRFTFEEVQTDSLPQCYQEIKEHLSSLQHVVQVPKKIDCLLIEDFNTSGLEGSLYKMDEDGKPLTGFWWEEGRSKKRIGSGGSHGVGKVTLSRASAFSFFMALTRRNADVGQPTELLLGYCSLPPHKIGKIPYLGYARFGNYQQDWEDEDKPLLPYRDSVSAENKFIEAFRKHTGLSRDREYGVSIFIPSVREGINTKEIIKNVISNYFLPIVNGTLRVEVVDKKVQTKEIIIGENLLELCEKFFETDERESLLDLIKLSRQALNIKMPYVPLGDFGKDNKQLTKDSFSADQIKSMKEEYESGKPIAVRFKIPIKTKTQGTLNGYCDVVVWYNGSQRKDYKAFRGNILVSNERCTSSVPFTSMLLDVMPGDMDGNPLSEYLKYAEDPGHTEWKASPTARNNDVYPQGEASWQKDFVKGIPASLLSVLSGIEKKESKDFADDIFYLEKASSTSEADSTPRKNSPKPESGDVSVEVPDIPEGRKQLLNLAKVSGGFVVTGTKHLAESMQTGNQGPKGKIRAAHIIPGTSRSRWFKFWISEDFDFTRDSSIESDGARILQRTGNQIEFEVESPDFRISFHGFDPNRDIHVDLRESSDA